MHLPDGFVSPPLSGALWVASAGALGAALKRANDDDREGQGGDLPLMGVAVAFIFTAQMFNFPIAGGTTGHLLGATLATALLGPWRGVVVLAVVLGVQALVFQDGGLLALGANVFNLGVAGCLVSGLLLGLAAPWSRDSAVRQALAVAVASWASVVTAAALVALELALSGTVPARVVLPAMLGVHAVIGVGEALLTVAAVGVLTGARPDLVARPGTLRGAEPWRLAALLGLGLVIVRLAFPHPDGLEWVAEQLGFVDHARGGFAAAPLPDYTVPGLAAPDGRFDWLGSYLSAFLGMALCAGAMVLLGGGRRRAVAAPEAAASTATR